MSRLIDLSHTISHGTVTYPGLPAPVISDHLSRASSAAGYTAGTTFQIARIDMVANTGTYVDTPSHRFEEGADIAAISLEQVADLDGVCIDATAAGRSIGATLIRDLDVRDRAVLIRTGWSRHFGTAAYATGHPFLTDDVAKRLVDSGARLVGIDSLNIDDIATGARPVHSTLLEAGVLIVEHLTNLEQLPTAGFRFFAVPPKLRGVGSFMVRAFAMV